MDVVLARVCVVEAVDSFDWVVDSDDDDSSTSDSGGGDADPAGRVVVVGGRAVLFAVYSGGTTSAEKSVVSAPVGFSEPAEVDPAKVGRVTTQDVLNAVAQVLCVS